MNKVKLGIIGLGNMGSAHVNSIGQIRNAELTALCDIDPVKLNRYEGKGYQLFPTVKIFSGKPISMPL